MKYENTESIILLARIFSETFCFSSVQSHTFVLSPKITHHMKNEKKKE